MEKLAADVSARSDARLLRANVLQELLCAENLDFGNSWWTFAIVT